MGRRFVSTAIFLSSITTALAQLGGGSGPGPGPAPNPWLVNGPTISYNSGGITLPSTVTGGTKGIGTINASNGYYVAGTKLLNIFSAGTGLALSGGGALNLQPAAAGTIGGVNSIAQVANNWVQYIDTAGLPHLAQPAFSNISGTASNAQLAVVGAATLKGNPTASAGVSPADFTLEGLASRGTPDGANDLLLIRDAATGTFKSITPSDFASLSTFWSAVPATTTNIKYMNGFVGIGNATPAAILDIVGNSGIKVTTNGSGITLVNSAGSGRTYGLQPQISGISAAGFAIYDLTASAFAFTLDDSRLPAFPALGGHGAGIASVDNSGNVRWAGSSEILVTNPPYNAACDGSTPDSAAIQLAINDATGTPGKVLTFPAATCRATGLTCADGKFLHLRGTNTLSALSSTNATQPILSAGTCQIQIEDLAFYGAPQTAGALIRVTGGVASDGFIHVTRGNFQSMYDGIYIAGSQYVSFSTFQQFANSGIHIRSALNCDGDGGTIGPSNLFYKDSSITPITQGDGILDECMGGLAILGNSFLGGNSAFFYNYDPSINANHVTSSIRFLDNKVEGLVNDVHFHNQSATLGGIFHVWINGNGGGVSSGVNVWVQDSGARQYIEHIEMSGNLFRNTSPGNHGLLWAGVNRGMVGPNYFYSDSASGSIAFQLDASTTNVDLNYNKNTGFGTVIVNSGAGNTCFPSSSVGGSPNMC